MYAENPIATPRNCVGYNSPANGYIIKKDADIADFDSRNKTNVVITASVNYLNKFIVDI